MHPQIAEGLTVTFPVPAAAIRVNDTHRFEAIGTGRHGWGVTLQLHNLHHVVVLANSHGTVTQPPGLVHLREGWYRTINMQLSLASQILAGEPSLHPGHAQGWS